MNNRWIISHEIFTGKGREMMRMGSNRIHAVHKLNQAIYIRERNIDIRKY